jgi:hypothetical protein
VNLTAALMPIHEVLTAAVCDEVFREVRTTERARKWTLDALLEFWVAVVTRAPTSLRAALDEYFGMKGASEERFETSPSSFFERSQNLDFGFFRSLFQRFTKAIAPQAPAVFETPLRAELQHYPEVWIVDGTALARVAHRLKATRDVEQILVPGSLLVCYDLFRGVPRVVEFSEELLGGEGARLTSLLPKVPAGTLLVGDRGYSSPTLFKEMSEKGVSGLLRLSKNITLEVEQELGRYEDEGCLVTDRIVIAGRGGKRSSRVRLRVIEKTLKDGEVLRLATNELDPARLPVSAALALYRRRWSIERLFFDLKEVLNLNRFYAANTNAVAMQVYASAIVYTALRTAQARIAQTHGLAPEDLSIGKLSPRVATAHFALVESLRILEQVKDLNPGVQLVMPDLTQSLAHWVLLSHVLVEKRKGPRKRRGYSAARVEVHPLRRYQAQRTESVTVKRRV